jgi:hypothetical protein
MKRKTALCIAIGVVLILLAVVAFAADVTKNRQENNTTTLTMIPKQSLAFGATDESKTFTLATTGQLCYWIMKVPNWTNVVTMTLSVTNGTSDPLWTDTARARNDTYVYAGADGGSPPIIPLSGLTTFTFTLSGAPGGSGGTVEFTPYVR